MSAPLVPSPLDYVGRRRFAFYPAIRNLHPNDWMLGARSWSEVQVVNAATRLELWIPSQYIGAVSDTGDFTMIVGLTQELEFAAGLLKPRVTRVIEMPHVPPAPAEKHDKQVRPGGRAPVVGIRLEKHEDSHIHKAIATLSIGAVVLSLLAALISAVARL